MRAVLALYDEPHRHYHDRTHVRERMARRPVAIPVVAAPQVMSLFLDSRYGGYTAHVVSAFVHVTF